MPNRGMLGDGLPDIFGPADMQGRKKKQGELYASISNVNFANLQSSFGFALHMHQPTIPAGSDDLRHAFLISNLQHMFEHQDIGDNHNASVFLWCYSRMSDFVRELAGQGKNPRVMFDYSGNLLWGLQQMEGGRVLDNLAAITCDSNYQRNTEWLGTMWSHAVVTSTPVPDLKLHMTAWRSHFASIFGRDALDRVKGFSPPEMHLPIHPDVCYEYVKSLKECGYEYVLVQEHTIENLDGSGIRRPHMPHRLVAKNSLGKAAEITAIVKTQGSDTKLVAQMQPYYEAKSRQPEEFYGKYLPPFVFQIADGENGGVMMNEFPPMFKQVFYEIGAEGVVAMNASEHLEFIRRAGITDDKFIPVQPVGQRLIWDNIKNFHPGACDEAIEKVKAKDGRFNLEKGSWTNDRDWVKGYQDVLDPINRLSVEFHRKYDNETPNVNDPAYRNALLYLLLSQTSCFRYWGSGIWTEYAKEICRRGMEALGK